MPAPPTGRTSTAPGPIMLTDFVSGNSNTYTKNPDYWDKEKIGGQEYKLPFVDKITYRTIKDEATYITALRTGKLDMLETIRWQNVDSLKKSAPQLAVEPLARTSRAPSWRCASTSTGRSTTCACAARSTWRSTRRRSSRRTTTATPSCSPIRMHPDYVGYFEPLDKMPASVRSSSSTIRRRPRSSWPKRATPTASPSRCRSARAIPDHMDLLPLVAAYLEQVGVKLEIQPHRVRRLPVGHDDAQACAGLPDEQRPHQPDDEHPQELRDGPACGTRRGWYGSQVRREDGRGLSRAATRTSARRCCAR